MPQQKMVPETVAELRDGVRDLLKDEHDRSNSLNSRGTALTGFVGVILSVATAAGVAIGTGSGPELSDRARLAVGLLMAGALLVLASAVVFVLIKVLVPKSGLVISTEDTDRFKSKEFTSRELVMTQGYFLTGYAAALKKERARNRLKATWLKNSYLLVVIGLGLVALAATTATLDRYVGDKREPEPRRTPHRTDTGKRSAVEPGANRGQFVS